MSDRSIPGPSGSPRLAVSVVIPAYNAAAYLADAVSSVRRQTVLPDEIIVVDDESTDGTRRLAESLGVIALRTGINGGPSKARNAGIKACAGDVVAFLDADDMWEPEHCEELLRLLHAFPQVGIVFGHVATFGEPGVRYMQRDLADSAAVNVWPDIAAYNYIPQTGCAVRRDLLLRVGGYDEALRVSEDYDLWLRLARLTLVACTHRFTVNYRVHGGQATRSMRQLFEAQTHVRARFFANLVAENGPDAAIVAARLRAAWATLLHTAWSVGDHEAWNATLSLAHEVPGSAWMARSWMLRRPIWPAWLMLRWAKATITGKTRKIKSTN